MDKETLTNHVSRLGKHYFESACRIVLTEVFQFDAINVDGAYDGGTDYASFAKDGRRSKAAYQITTQKTDIQNKAYKDAEKAINKLEATKFFFFTVLVLPETQVRIIENQIERELSISATCLDASTIAGLLLSEGLLHTFLHQTNYPVANVGGSLSYSDREMALHSYTLISTDSRTLRESIYDDTILFVISENGPSSEEDIVDGVSRYLSLPGDKTELLHRRIGALFGKKRIERVSESIIALSNESRSDVDARKEIYKRELNSLVSAQVDLMRGYGIDWNVQDATSVSVWLAEVFIADQIDNLREIKASVVSHPVFRGIDNTGMDKLKAYLRREKNVAKTSLERVVYDLIEIASKHPLISKLSRASMYLATQATNPVASAKALGASRWSEFSMVVEPTTAIPHICSQLYHGQVNRYFDNAIRSVDQAKSLDIRLTIPYFYINECAGHLLSARKYCGLDLSEDEERYSSNAFIANYFALKSQGVAMPDSLMDYLTTFSPAVLTEKSDTKTWVRAIMTDIQSILNRSGVEFLEVPFYDHQTSKEFESEYAVHLHNYHVDKPNHLVSHDVWALQFTNDSIANRGENWIILTYDRTLVSFGKSNVYRGWITPPPKFLDMTQSHRPLSETEFISLLHTVASYSERTLAIGARIMDKIVMYASKDMQNWQFRRDIDSFKEDLVESLSEFDYDHGEVDRRTLDFLSKHGIPLGKDDETSVDN